MYKDGKSEQAALNDRIKAWRMPDLCREVEAPHTPEPKSEPRNWEYDTLTRKMWIRDVGSRPLILDVGSRPLVEMS